MITFIPVLFGALCGVLVRWFFATALNPLTILLPPGTLVCNLVGCYFMGIIVGLTKTMVVPEYLRLGIVVGFLGSLTTFSTYTAEAMNLLFTKHYYWFFVLFLSHNVGTLLMMLLGLYTVHYLKF